METQSLIRWGGLSALLGGAIGICGEIVFFISVGDQAFSLAALTTGWLVILLIMMASAVLAMFGLTALYACQVKQAGKLGLTGFIFAVVGLLMHFGHTWSSTFVLPVLAQGVPDYLESMLADTSSLLVGGVLLTWLLWALGWLLFGAASLRAGVMPSGAAWAVILGGILSLVLSFMDISLDGIVLYIGLIWMGLWLWTRQAKTG